MAGGGGLAISFCCGLGCPWKISVYPKKAEVDRTSLDRTITRPGRGGVLEEAHLEEVIFLIETVIPHTSVSAYVGFSTCLWKMCTMKNLCVNFKFFPPKYTYLFTSFFSMIFLK